MLDKRFRKIFITLGHQCNFNCMYCLQDEGFEKNACVPHRPKLSNRLLRYLDNYKYEGTTIMFWGGEPLFYLPSIKAIVERYGDKFRYSMVTNGSMLNHSILDFLEEYKIHFAISHDGYVTKTTRGMDVLNLHLPITKRLKTCKVFDGFSSVISDVNDDFLSLVDYFKNKGFGHKNISIDMIFNTTDAKALQRLSEIDTDDYRRHFKELLKNFDTEDPQIMAIVTYYLQKLDLKLKNPSLLEGCNPICESCRNMLNLDTEGNVYICHNSSYDIGTVDNDYETLYQAYLAYLRTKFTAKCATCDISHVCCGACLLLTEKGQESYCMIRRIEVEELLEWLHKKKGELENDNSAT